ncbi:unnamed protein product [Cuscuta epithymum]|uniref:Uncharacterized protein n=1 Tax=Cuscuta epithymum TaxID=186058 RepID=A0AAV0E4U9_9ASTE|nr:unnamed protein product [Cuscuta epithymum]
MPKEIRILKYLLTIEDPEQRISALKDAFTPGEELEGKDVDLLYTSDQIRIIQIRSDQIRIIQIRSERFRSDQTRSNQKHSDQKHSDQIRSKSFKHDLTLLLL